MLTCRHCGWENPDEAAFCTNCGRGLARGRGGDGTDRPSQRFRALGSPVVRVSDPPAPAPAPAMPRLNPPPSTGSSAPTLLDFRMPEQMLAELARARDARLREPELPETPAPEVAGRLEPETLEPEMVESEPPDDEAPAPPTRAAEVLPATLQDLPTVRPSRPVELGAVARALRAEAGSPPRTDVEEVVVIARSVAPEEINQLLGGALDADLPPLQILPDDGPFDESAFDDGPFPVAGEAAEVDARPTIRLEAPAELALLRAPPSEGLAAQGRVTQEDLPFTLPVDESADLMPDHFVEVADDSQSGVEEPDEFADLLDGPAAPEGDDLVDDADDFIEEVDEGSDLIASGELEAVNIEALRAAPPPLPAKNVRFLLRPLSENLDPNLLVAIATEPLTIGRSEGEVRFEGDEYVSPRHARLTLEGEELFVEDLGSLNGVWIRVRGDAALVAGARFLVGQHVFRLEHLPVGGTRSRPEDGTRRLGAEPRHTPFQVVVQAGDGTTTHVHRLQPEGCRVGRHVADLVFTDDSFMSGTHALLRPRDDVVLLRDLASRNGTWLRIEGRTRLEAGDALMIGRSVVRVGAPAS